MIDKILEFSLRQRAIILLGAVGLLGGLWSAFHLPIDAVPDMCALFSPGIAPAADPISLGQFEGHGNIGSRRNAGAASYDAFSQEHEIAGSAVNVRGVKDDLHFVWKRQPFTANRGRNKRLTSHNPGESATGQET